MNLIRKFFLLAIIMPGALYAAGPLSGTDGNNLTSFNGSLGSANNNNWNSLTNNKPTANADFGNCNAIIMRCAQPKCATGGCTNMDIAAPIVRGCVNANSACKSYGDDLVQYIAAQLVASSTVKANEQAAQVNAAATEVSAQQSAQQLAAVQSQMQTLQDQIASQNEQTNETVKSALAQQQELFSQQQTQSNNSAASDAIDKGVSTEVLIRQQASGDIMTKLENATDSMKALKKIMQTAFDYAGCDASGNNCTGPKRIAVFKDKANDFFDPYNNVLDQVYDALITAQALGVDISDIYMLLNNSCNQWGKYLCEPCPGGTDCEIATDATKGYYTVAKDPDTNKISGNQPHCTFMQLLTSRDDIQLNWLDMDAGSSGGVRVACASDILDNSKLFKNRKKESNVDIEILQRILEQDSPNYLGNRNDTSELYKYCSVGSKEFTDLQKITKLKKLPDTMDICVTENGLKTDKRIVNEYTDKTLITTTDGTKIGKEFDFLDTKKDIKLNNSILGSYILGNIGKK